MFFRARRGEPGPDRFLGVKHSLLWLGLGLGLIGMSVGLDWLVWMAIAVLAVAVGLAAWGRRQRDRAEMEAAWEATEDQKREV